MPINDSLHIIMGQVDSLKGMVSKALEPSPTVVVIRDTIVTPTVSSTPMNNSTIINTIDLNISAWLIIVFLGLGVGLYFLLAFLKKYILPVVVQRYKKKQYPFVLVSLFSSDLAGF